jgi:hypothetical protein
MKLHPGLFALALLALSLACNGTGNNNAGGNAGNSTANNANNSASANNSNNANAVSSTNSVNSANNSNLNANSGTAAADVHVEDLYMAKDKGGTYGDKTESFGAADRTVYAVAKLNTAVTGTKVRFVWYTVDVAGKEKNAKFKEEDYTTKASEVRAMAHLSLPGAWPKGKYKVEAYVNDKLDKTVEYTVQ